MARRQVPAILVDSVEAVIDGPPGAYFISKDGKEFHLRCPCGGCQKHNTLPLVAGNSRYSWKLRGRPDRPSLSPSIHWMNTNGRTTHWHGWLRNGVFEG